MACLSYKFKYSVSWSSVSCCSKLIRSEGRSFVAYLAEIDSSALATGFEIGTAWTLSPVSRKQTVSDEDWIRGLLAAIHCRAASLLLERLPRLLSYRSLQNCGARAESKTKHFVSLTQHVSCRHRKQAKTKHWFNHANS